MGRTARVARFDAGRVAAVVGGSVGNLVEWFDWYVYSAFSLYFAKVFFPRGDSTAQLLNAAAVFAVGFLMRPVGGWVLGRYADRHGRRAALTLSVLLMCSGSLLIAVTPGYATIGIGAPVLLVLARLLQGFSVGGEYGVSATYLSEVASREHRGFYSSFQYVTLILGQLLALGLLLVLQTFVLTPAELAAWGWRIPFVIGALCALVALWLRRGLAETEAFTAASVAASSSNATATVAPRLDAGRLRLLLQYPRELMVVVGLTMGGTLAFYTFTTYMQKFLVNTARFDAPTATLVSAATLLVFMLLQPLVGALSDRVGRRPVLIAFGVLGSTLTVPLLSALAAAPSPVTAFLLLLGALAIVSGYTSISAVVKAELFPVQIRALGVGLPYALAVSVFGGTAEYVALWFKSVGHESGFYWYVTGCIAISLLVYLGMRETRDTSRI
jgi:MHS family alpha-ketoglutarate permease-like MFS transporter